MRRIARAVARLSDDLKNDCLYCPYCPCFWIGTQIAASVPPWHGAFTLSPYAQKLVKAKHRFN